MTGYTRLWQVYSIIWQVKSELYFYYFWIQHHMQFACVVYAGIFKQRKNIPKYEKLMVILCLCTRHILLYPTIYCHMTSYDVIWRYMVGYQGVRIPDNGSGGGKSESDWLGVRRPAGGWCGAERRCCGKIVSPAAGPRASVTCQWIMIIMMTLMVIISWVICGRGRILLIWNLSLALFWIGYHSLSFLWYRHRRHGSFDYHDIIINIVSMISY
jgi:hypothetical protein